MANPTTTFDLTISTTAWLATAYGDATIGDVAEIKKIDESPTLASDSDTTASSWWADATDDAVIALHTALSRARKTWQGADLAALEALGTSDGLSVGDYGWPSDATVGDGTLYQCATAAVSSSTWATVAAGRGWYDGSTKACAVGDSLSADVWDSWGFDLSSPGTATLALPTTASGGDRIRIAASNADLVGVAHITGYAGSQTLIIPSAGVRFPTDPLNQWIEIEYDGGKWYRATGDVSTTIKRARPFVDVSATVTRYDFDRSDAASLPTTFDPASRISASTVYQQHSAIKIATTASGSHGWCGVEVPLPATTGVRVTVRMWTTAPVGSYNLLGLMLRDATSKLWGLHYSAGTSSIYQLSYFSTPTTYTSNTFSQAEYTQNRLVTLRATKGGAGWIWAWSDDDGISWVPVPYSGAGVAVPGAMGTLTHAVVGISSTTSMVGNVWIDSIVVEELGSALAYDTPAVMA